MATTKIPVVQVRSAFNYDQAAVSEATGLACLDPSRAVQSQAEEADINTIVRRFGVTGNFPTPTRLPTYGDFEGVEDYQTALAALRAAESAFLAVPAEIRARFENDAGQFVDFCSDPSNLDELRKLGLAPPAPVPPPAA